MIGQAYQCQKPQGAPQVCEIPPQQNHFKGGPPWFHASDTLRGTKAADAVSSKNTFKNRRKWQMLKKSQLTF